MTISLQDLYIVLYHDVDKIPREVRVNLDGTSLRSIPFRCGDNKARIIPATVAEAIMEEPKWEETFHIYPQAFGWYVCWCKVDWQESNERYWQSKEHAEIDRSAAILERDNRIRIDEMAERAAAMLQMKKSEILVDLTFHAGISEEQLHTFVKGIEMIVRKPVYIEPKTL